MSDNQPQPVSFGTDAPTLAAMQALAIGDSIRVNGGREDIKRVSDDRWLLSIHHEGALEPLARLGIDGDRLTTQTAEPALLPRRVKPWQIDITFQTTQFDEAAFNQLVEDARRAAAIDAYQEASNELHRGKTP